MIDNKDITLKIKKHHLNTYLEKTLNYCIEKRKINLLDGLIRKKKGDKSYGNINKYSKSVGQKKIEYIKEFASRPSWICQKKTALLQ